MNKDYEYLKKNLKEMEELLIKKNHDYAEDSDVYSGFKICEKLGVCKAEEGIIVRITDKLGRVVQLLKKDAKVSDESIHDTLIDLANYALLLDGLRNNKK